MSYDHAQYFHELSPEFIERLVHINVVGTTKMTHIVLPGMVERF
jgi:17beta-estradiol 17-dehydrogenase / very-long-chain 3-oxoacyl-CoA reductase